MSFVCSNIIFVRKNWRNKLLKEEFSKKKEIQNRKRMVYLFHLYVSKNFFFNKRKFEKQENVTVWMYRWCFGWPYGVKELKTFGHSIVLNGAFYYLFLLTVAKLHLHFSLLSLLLLIRQYVKPYLSYCVSSFVC